MANSDREETYSEEETVARREAALKQMLATPPKPHKKGAADARKSDQRRP